MHSAGGYPYRMDYRRIFSEVSRLCCRGFLLAAFFLNVLALAEPPQAVVFSPEGRAFSRSVEVTLSCPTPNAQIVYTTDGSVPTLEQGSRYTGAAAEDLKYDSGACGGSGRATNSARAPAPPTCKLPVTLSRCVRGCRC